MKKRIALALAGMFVLAISSGFAHADPVNTPIATVTANEGGYLVYADGNADNPGPLSGWIAVYGDGSACADDHGSDDGLGSPTCTP